MKTEQAKQNELNRVSNYYVERFNEIKKSLSECNSEADIKGKWFLSQFITPTTAEKDLSVSQLSEQILKIAKNRFNKRMKKDIEEVERIFSAGEIKEIRVSIEWKKSRMWGANPTATVEIYGDNYEYLSSGSISGCGYDKESTAFADAINKSYAFRKLMLCNTDGINNDYGHRNGRLSGGVGVSCYYSIFEHLEFKMKHVASGKMFDAYKIVKDV